MTQAPIPAESGITVYEASLNTIDGCKFFIGRKGEDKDLYLLGPASIVSKFTVFEGEHISAGFTDNGEILCRCPLSHRNAKAVRDLFAFTRPCLIGLENSFGFGDRLGIANPGHLRALKDESLQPVLAQQSIRELERTERTPEEVMDAATWAVFQEGYKEGFGSDADHLKSTEDIDLMINAGFTMFTIDPGEHVINEADSFAEPDLLDHVRSLDWELLEDTLEDYLARYADQRIVVDSDFSLSPERDETVRALVKYGGVIAHTVGMVRYLLSTYPEHDTEIELSVDETDSVTSPFEHYMVVNELKRLGIELVSLAPRFVGDFEKGIDYKGDLDRFREEYLKHMAIAEFLGPYKISFHSGSDKFKIYDLVGSLGSKIHIKTAGTSYLEALRTIAVADTMLFREILDFARKHYPAEKRTYHVSADLQSVHPASTYSNSELVALFDQEDARQVLHVTFGKVLTTRAENGDYLFKDRLMEALDRHEALHYENLAHHLGRHLKPFVQ